MKQFENINYINDYKVSAEMAEAQEKLPKEVYYISSPDDDTVLVGIDVTIEHGENNSMVRWYDTTRERAMMAEAMKKDGDKFAFKRIEEEGGGNYYFTPMNLEIYEDNVKDRLIEGRDFKNDEDLIRAFKETLEDE
jgi:hypothetical protein